MKSRHKTEYEKVRLVYREPKPVPAPVVEPVPVVENTEKPANIPAVPDLSATESEEDTSLE